jgi:methyl-accepting chemotaxis protein
MLVLGFAVLGVRWIRDLAARSARAGAELTARALLSAPEIQGAQGGQASTEHLDRLFLRALDNDPNLAYVALRLPRHTHLSVRPDAEGARLREQSAALHHLHDGLRGPALRTVAGMDLVLARVELPPSAAGPIEATGPGQAPTLFVAVSLSRSAAPFQAGLLLLLGVAGAGVLGYVLLSIFLLSGFLRRLAQLGQGARRMGDGDLHARVGSAAEDELGEISRSLDAALHRIAGAVEQAGQAGAALQAAARDVSESTALLRRGVSTQIADTDDALLLMRDIAQALPGSGQRIESVRDETRLAATVASRLLSLSHESVAAMEEAERVAGTAQEGVQQAAIALADLSRQAGSVTETAAGTISAMNDVRHAINRVRDTATSAAHLAEHASADAERGTLVLAESLAGIEHIRDASRAIGAVTDDLQRRVGEIGDVLHLITELTQRTNLLALNASIIAAQAGAEGRGFAVVADEIKDLARRTANSASTIDTLIGALAEGAHAARRAALAGGEAVETGVAQARDAARVMKDILTRLRSWSQMARSIAAMTEDQARGSVQVTRAIQDAQAGMAEVVSGLSEQARRGEHLGRQGARLREVVGALSGTASEQREGMAQVADTLGRLLRAVEEMGGTERRRIADAERVRGLLEMLRRAALGHREAVVALERAGTELRAQAALLAKELGRLRT